MLKPRRNDGPARSGGWTGSKLSVGSLIAVGLAIVLLTAAGAASAFVSANTIDRQATLRADGERVRVTGPIGCSAGERVSIGVTVTQGATEAPARRRWTARCTGELQHWQVRASARRGTRFEVGRGKVCAVARTRSASYVTDTHKWCEPVLLSAVFGSE